MPYIGNKTADTTLVEDNSITSAKIVNDAVIENKLNLISTSSVPSLEAKGDGSSQDGYIQLNCSQNSHGVKLKSPPHSANQSYTLTLPSTAPATDKIMQTDSSGNLSFVDAPSGNLVKITSGSVSAGDAYVALTNKFSSTYKIYKIFLYDWNTSQDSEVRLRWLTGGSGNVESGSNTYFVAGSGYNTDGGGSSWQAQSDYMRIAGEDVRHDADEHFAWEGTLYNPAGTTLKKRLVFAGGGRRTGNYTFSAHGTGEWNSTTAITGVRIFTSGSATFDSLSYAIYGIAT